jgi:hypothetical protein
VTAAPRAVTVVSPAKINLFLEILRRRPDGYHTLSTLFQEITLFDTLHVRVKPGEGMSLTTDASDLKADDSNLVLRAARAFKTRFPRTPNLHFSLTKRIPIGAGLGGGSSNAAMALKACRLFPLRFLEERGPPSPSGPKTWRRRSVFSERRSRQRWRHRRPTDLDLSRAPPTPSFRSRFSPGFFVDTRSVSGVTFPLDEAAFPP